MDGSITKDRVIKSLSLLGLTNIDILDITSKTLNKAKRKLLMQYHPDLASQNNLSISLCNRMTNDIIDAFEFLSSHLDDIQSREILIRQLSIKYVRVKKTIQLSDLIRVLNGDEIEYPLERSFDFSKYRNPYINRDNTFTLNKDSLHSNEIFIEIDTFVYVNGESLSIKTILPFTRYSNYPVPINLNVEKSDVYNIRIGVLDKCIDLSITSKNISLPVKLNNRCVIDYTISIRNKVEKTS